MKCERCGEYYTVTFGVHDDGEVCKYCLAGVDKNYEGEIVFEIDREPNPAWNKTPDDDTEEDKEVRKSVIEMQKQWRKENEL